jgi:hypothetical protein
VPDGKALLDPIARRSLEPILEDLVRLLADEELPDAAAFLILQTLAEAYVAGHADGARHAVGQVAVEAARRGLHLRLAPELEAR